MGPTATEPGRFGLTRLIGLLGVLLLLDVLIFGVVMPRFLPIDGSVVEVLAEAFTG